MAQGENDKLSRRLRQGVFLYLSANNIRNETRIYPAVI